MKIVETRFLRGPNRFSRRPCFQAVLDLEDLDQRRCTDFPGFAERLAAAIPSLYDHRCSRGREGGFIERLREGMPVAHVVERLLPELQCLAGTEVGFCLAREIRGRPRHHQVVCAYQLESVVAAALPMALAALQALCRGEAIELDDDIGALRDLAARAQLGAGTRAIVEAAGKRGIPSVRVSEEAGLIQLGWGKHQKRIRATVTSNTSQLAVEIAGDKDLTKALLHEIGIHVPRGEVVATAEQAVTVARHLGGPVVVKPLGANHGKGVSTALVTPDEVRAAFERARRLRSRIIVERYLEGADHRVIVVDGRFLAAARRSPPQVVGDGRMNVMEMIHAENANPARGDGRGSVLTRIPVDETTHEILARQGLSLEAVPPAGMRVMLRGTADLSTGGTAEDVTERTHPEVARACVRAARAIGLDVAGIDLVCRDISQPLHEQGGGIVDVSAAPGICMHEHPIRGDRHPVGEAILETLYPQGEDGRVPLVAVTGSNGKTTTTLLVAHGMHGAGRVTGVATTEGVRIGEHRVRNGDCSDFWSARSVLSAPEVEAAALETAPGGILERGLGFDRCDVAVVTNVEDDPDGHDFVESAEELARAARVVVESASRAVVLNAQDERCVAMAGSVDPAARLVYFSLHDDDPVVLEHLERGGSAVYTRKDMIMMASGKHRIPLVEVRLLAFALHGLARHNVANALAAAAALWACGLERERIVDTLATFRSTVERNPLRLNLFTARGVHILLDCARNAASYRALVETARGVGARRIVGVVAAPGASRGERLRDIGAICGRGFDEMVVYEPDERRGRARGGAAARIARGALEAGADESCIATVDDIRSALRRGIERCAPGDLLVVGCASRVEDLIAAIPDAEEVAELPPAMPRPELPPDAPRAPWRRDAPLSRERRQVSRHH